MCTKRDVLLCMVLAFFIFLFFSTAAEAGKPVRNDQHGFVITPPSGWREIPVPPPSEWGSEWDVYEPPDEKKEEKKPRPRVEMVANFDSPPGTGYETYLRVWRIRNVNTLEEAVGVIEKAVKEDDSMTIESAKDVVINKAKARKYLITTKRWCYTLGVVFNHKRAFLLEYLYPAVRAKGLQKAIDKSLSTFIILKDAKDAGDKPTTTDHAEARLPAGWKRLQTKRYNFEYNCTDAIGKEFATYLENFMTKIMDLYKLSEEERNTLPRFTVKLFNKYDDFSAYASADGVYGAAAYFSPSQKHLVTCASYMGGKTEAFGILYHEATHQFVYFYFGEETNVPIWLNEGLAEYFNAAGQKDKKNLKLGAPLYDRLQYLKDAIRKNKTVPLKTLFQMTRAQFYANAALCYAQGWAITHYFLHTTNQKHRDMYFRFCELLRKCKGMTWEKRREEWRKRRGKAGVSATDDDDDDKYDPFFLEKEAFNEAFRDVDYEELEKGWKEMILKMS